jgi:hypothetical protein
MKGMKTGGRKKGSVNKSTRDVQVLVDKVFKKVEPVQKIVDLLNKPMDVNVEARVLLRLLEYRYGQPTASVEHSGPDGGPVALLLDSSSLPARDDGTA